MPWNNMDAVSRFAVDARLWPTTSSSIDLATGRRAGTTACGCEDVAATPSSLLNCPAMPRTAVWVSSAMGDSLSTVVQPSLLAARTEEQLRAPPSISSANRLLLAASHAIRASLATIWSATAAAAGPLWESTLFSRLVPMSTLSNIAEQSAWACSAMPWNNMDAVSRFAVDARLWPTTSSSIDLATGRRAGTTACGCEDVAATPSSLLNCPAMPRTAVWVSSAMGDSLSTVVQPPVAEDSGAAAAGAVPSL